MKIGPKYKIARRLGAPIFEKTQTQKFALSAEKKGKKGFPRAKSDFGIQLVEKQKARFFYAVTEKQFKNYVKAVIEKKGASPAPELYSKLESRLDNVVWRSGLAKTHLGARQMVAHGHILVNGRKSYTPSQELKPNDTISIREGSKTSPLFNREDTETPEIPNWIAYDASKKEAVVKAKPSMTDKELMFDLTKVIEFYQR